MQSSKMSIGLKRNTIKNYEHKFNNLHEINHFSKIISYIHSLKIKSHKWKYDYLKVLIWQLKTLEKYMRPNGFKGKLYKTFKKEVTILHNFFQIIEEEEKFPNSFYKVSNSLIPRPDRLSRKLWTNSLSYQRPINFFANILF